MSCEIRNADLILLHIPDKNSDYGTIADFALTFDAYDRFDKVAEFANNNLSAYHPDRESMKQRTLTELHACLFYKQRRFRYVGEEPSEEVRVYINALLIEIANRCRDIGVAKQTPGARKKCGMRTFTCFACYHTWTRKALTQ